MKRLYTYITIITLGLATFCSCAEEEIICTFAESGNDVTLKLSVQTQANKNIEVSRTAADEKLYDLHFYVFNAQGELTGYEKLVSGSGNLPSPGPIDISIRTKSGESYVYAVANINNSANYYLSKTDKNLLDVYGSATINLSNGTLQLNNDEVLVKGLENAIIAAHSSNCAKEIPAATEPNNPILLIP